MTDTNRSSDLGVSLPAAAALATGSTDQAAPPGSLSTDREDFTRVLEFHMRAMVSEIEYLVELHKQWGDTLQKDYLYKARLALLNGLDWFDWSRRNKHG